MSTYPCPKGHNSTESDYCSECGAKIDGAPVAIASRTIASLPIPSSLSQICPDCGTPHDADSGNFCEICGYNFVTQAHGEVPIAVTHPPVVEPLQINGGAPQSPQPEPAQPAAVDASFPSPPAPSRWELAIAVDSVVRDPASPAPPNHIAPFSVRIEQPTSLIGRTSQARAIHPEIPLDFDDAVSHRHAVLSLNADGTLTLRDIGSSNGTRLNQVELKPMTDTPLKPGDEISLGHWTTIKILGY